MCLEEQLTFLFLKKKKKKLKIKVLHVLRNLVALGTEVQEA